MSRSRKKSPVTSWCGNSEKKDKRIWHKRFRAALRNAIHHQKEIMPHFREVSNVWDMNKDGTRHWDNFLAVKYLRK